MAEFTLEQDPTTGISVVRIVGDLQHGEIGAFMRGPEYSALGRKTLWDYRETTMRAVSSEQLIEGFDGSKHLVSPEDKNAAVYANHTDFGVGRMFQGRADLEDSQFVFEVFMDYDAAVAWLLNDDPAETES